MTIRALAFVACVALTGCTTAEQISRRNALEGARFQEPGHTATISKSNSAQPTPRPRDGGKISSLLIVQRQFIKSCPKKHPTNGP
jgi:hypothetical protein